MMKKSKAKKARIWWGYIWDKTPGVPPCLFSTKRQANSERKEIERFLGGLLGRARLIEVREVLK